MSAGIRAEISLDGRTSCIVAGIAADADASTQSISKSVAPDVGTVTEEFVLDGRFDGPPERAEEVFSYGSKHVYRFSREAEERCPCGTVEASGSPVVDVSADGGRLSLAFHAADMDQLQLVVRELKANFGEVSVERLVRSRDDDGMADLVLVDRGELTHRQREVLETANQMGYFGHPKGANAGEVAEALGITTSTFTEHLAAAQSKLLSAILSA